MSVYRSDDGRWRFRVTGVYSDGGTERVSGSAPKTDNTKAAAQRAEAQQLAFMAARPKPKDDAPEDTHNTTPPPQSALPAQPAPVPVAKVPTIAEFVPEFLQAARIGNKLSRIEDRERVVNMHIVSRLGHVRLDALDFATVNRFKVQLSDHPTKRRAGTMQPGTVNNVLKTLQQMMLMARECKLISELPKIKKLKVPEARFDFLSFEEADRLVAAAEGDWRTMVIVALRTGVRRGELVALRREAVNRLSNSLDVQSSYYRKRFTLPKGNRARSIPLSRQALETLDAHRPACTSGLLFCDAAGVPFTRSAMDAALRRLCRRAKLGRQIGWHVLRHTFASHLVMRGVPLRAVQDLMGHASIVMTQRYAHLAPHITTESVQLLDGGSGRTNPPVALAPGAAEGEKKIRDRKRAGTPALTKKRQKVTPGGRK